ncbi:phage protein Gp36 family protein [Chryseobacterium bernardetii]|uniref:phage protein Gp36 family protein n=1 Tax=Chryseobacterium bernardetii TaxID=1241978 RepID=UPI003AF43766
MFLEIEDLKNVIYGYQIDQITEQNENITLQAIAAAEQEVRSYLANSSKKSVRYDIEAIMNATGDHRNAIILSHTATIAKYYIIELCNVDIIYETAKDRYDRAVSWLKMLSKGDISLDTLPTIDDTTPGTGDNDTYPFVYGSREKFNHE